MVCRICYGTAMKGASLVLSCIKLMRCILTRLHYHPFIIIQKTSNKDNEAQSMKIPLIRRILIHFVIWQSFLFVFCIMTIIIITYILMCYISCKIIAKYWIVLSCFASICSIKGLFSKSYFHGFIKDVIESNMLVEHNYLISFDKITIL